MTRTEGVVSAPHHDDVVVVRWPEQRADAERLTRLLQPHLLLVEPGVAPPVLTSCIADWIRLPADDADVRARLTALTARARKHPMIPVIDEFGELSYGGRRVFLSHIEQQLAEMLVASYDRGVADEELFQTIWGGDGEASKVRVHVSRLRKRLQPMGLEITSLRGFGYRLHAAEERAHDYRDAGE